MHNMAENKYYVDLHVHTRRYSPCAELLDPALLVKRLQTSLLNGIVIAEHDNLWSKEEIKELNTTLLGKKIYRGVEVSSSLGHLVIIGIDDLNGCEPGVPVNQLIRRATKDRAAVILVHHHLNKYGAGSPFSEGSLPAGIDAIEVASTVTFGDNQLEAERIAKDKGWIPVAGSDAHCIENVGLTCTAFPDLPCDEKDLAKAICMGIGIPIRLDAGIES